MLAEAEVGFKTYYQFEYKEFLSAVTRRRSGRNVSPVIMQGCRSDNKKNNNEIIKDPKTTNGQTYKFNNRKLTAQCLQKLLVFISFQVGVNNNNEYVDIQVGFKTYCQFEYKEFFISCDKKKIRAEYITGNYGSGKKTW